MRVAVLKGNRFNPWHLRVFNHLPDDVRPVAFRAESEIQQRMAAQDDGSVRMPVERVAFQASGRGVIGRIAQSVRARSGSVRQHVVPFHGRLEGFDLLLTWELFTDWTNEALEAKRVFGTPVAVVVWDNIPFNHEDDETASAIKARAVAEADLFIVHTERSRRTLHIEGVTDDRIRVIPHGVDAEAFAPGYGDRSAFGFSDSEFVLLFVGWLVARKGLDYLLLALDELRRDDALTDVAFRLHVVGSGPARERIDRLIARLGLADVVRFTDSLRYDRMVEAYRAADVFVLPSVAAENWQEQFGMSLMEAMSCELPCVSTWSGAIPEILGEAGRLCQPNDFVSLYEAIRELALDSDARAALGQAGRQRVIDQFTLEAYAAGLNDTLRELVGP